MAKKQEGTSIRIDPLLARDGGMIAAWLGKSLTEYVNERMRDIIAVELPTVLKEASADPTRSE